MAYKEVEVSDYLLQDWKRLWAKLTSANVILNIDSSSLLNQRESK